jgi:hypothetical protein
MLLTNPGFASMKSKTSILETPLKAKLRPARMELFISYAHADEDQLESFRPHLTHLSQQGYIQVWNDRELVAGEKWEKGLLDALRRVDIVLLFYTIHARVSKFIQEIELPTSLDRSDANECTLIWVPLERNDLDEMHPLERRLKKLRSATRDARPVYDFAYVQRGWTEVEHAIRQAVEARRARAPAVKEAVSCAGARFTRNHRHCGPVRTAFTTYALTPPPLPPAR